MARDPFTEANRNVFVEFSIDSSVAWSTNPRKIKQSTRVLNRDFFGGGRFSPTPVLCHLCRFHGYHVKLRTNDYDGYTVIACRNFVTIATMLRAIRLRAVVSKLIGTKRGINVFRTPAKRRRNGLASFVRRHAAMGSPAGTGIYSNSSITRALSYSNN